MSNFNLGLPIDIPWNRVCYSEDMQNWNDCDGPLPPQWRSSIAVYTYEPEDQIANPLLQGHVISYVKVAVSIAPHAPDTTGPNGPTAYLDYVSADYLPTTYPCYGAILQVTVRPETPGSLPHNDWPYFLDAEPKTREIYESKSETGETLAGSSNSLAVGKSATSTQSVEAKFGITLPIPGLSVSGGASSTTSQTHSEISESSSERRETQGYVTQLSQMYHLLQAYHVGSNRAMFFMEPRPHILGAPATFINAPRQMEGMQEVFLIVANKIIEGSTAPLCFNVKLDTAHLWTWDQQRTGEAPSGLAPYTRKVTKSFHFKKSGPSTDDATETYDAPPGWKIQGYSVLFDDDMDSTIDYDLKREDQQLDVRYTPTWLQSIDDWGKSFEIRVEITIIRIEESEGKSKFAGMFLTTRNLCCCDPEEPSMAQELVTHTKTFLPPTLPPPQLPSTLPPQLQHNQPPFPPGVPPANVPITPALPPLPPVGAGGFPTGGAGVMTPQNIVTSRQIIQVVKEEMLKSTQSATTDGVPFTQSDVYFNQLLNIAIRTNPELSKPISLSRLLTPTQRDLFQSYLGTISVSTLIGTDSTKIAGITGMAIADVRALKDQLLRGAKPLPPAPPAANPLRNILSLQILTSGQNPNYPVLLYDMRDPRQMPTLNSQDQPNIIDVEFSGQPDSGTVSTSSFVVTQGGTTLPATVQQLTLTKYRLILTAPLLAAGTYGITIKGLGGSAITFGGQGLDGTPVGPLPSGDGITPGDFTTAINVVVPLPSPLPPAPIPTLLKIIAARIKTDVGTPATMYEMVIPGTIPTFSASANANIIEVNFSAPPDAGTVTTTTFNVTGPLGLVPGSIVTVNATTFQFKATAPFAAGAMYAVTLKGSGTPAITLSGSALDGDPLALPSGNGVAGTNFTFQYQIS